MNFFENTDQRGGEVVGYGRPVTSEGQQAIGAGMRSPGGGSVVPENPLLVKDGPSQTTNSQSGRPSAVSRLRFWETERGQAVRGYFEAYGAVVKEREVTGDLSAVPAPESTVVGGSRGAPSNVADILLKYTEVKRFLDQGATRRQAALINFIYVDGTDFRTEIQYIFTDGSTSEWLEADTHEPPLVPVKEVTTRSEKIYTYDLTKFEAPELEEVARHWRTTKQALLRREHERCGRSFGALL